jgi:hypothetical protein
MRVIFILIFFSLFLCSQTINEQIHALDKATPTERVALMNSIKEQLISMNTERRMKTIASLQAKLQHKSEEQEVANETQNVHTEETKESHSHVKEGHGLEKEMMHKDESVHMQNELHQHQHNRRSEQNENRAGGEHGANQHGEAK